MCLLCDGVTPLTTSRRWAAGLALAATLLLPGAAAAAPYIDDEGLLAPLSADDIVGAGAVFRPQTPASIVARGGTLRGPALPLGIEVAGVQSADDGAVLDGLGNRDNVASGAAFAPQTPFSIFAHGGSLADATTTDDAGR